MSFGVTKPSVMLGLTNCLEQARNSVSEQNAKGVTEKIQEFANLLLTNIKECKPTDPNLTHLIIEMIDSTDSYASDPTYQVLANTIKLVMQLTPNKEMNLGFEIFVQGMKNHPSFQVKEIIKAIENTSDTKSKLNLLKQLLVNNPDVLASFLNHDKIPALNSFVNTALLGCRIDLNYLDRALLQGDVDKAKNLLDPSLESSLTHLEKVGVQLSDLPQTSQDLIKLCLATPKVKIITPSEMPSPPPDKVALGLGVAGTVLPLPQNIVRTIVQRVPPRIDPVVINTLISDQTMQYVKFVGEIPKEVFTSIGIMGNTMELASLLRRIMSDNPELKIRLDDLNEKIRRYEVSNQKNHDYEKSVQERNHLLAEEIRRQSKIPLLKFTTKAAESFIPLLRPIKMASEFWMSWNTVKGVQEKLNLIQGTIDNLDNAIHELKNLSKSTLEPTKSIYKMKIKNLETKKSQLLKTVEELRHQGLVPAIVTGLASVSLGLIVTGSAMYALSSENNRNDFGIDQYKGGSLGALTAIVSLLPVAQALWQIGAVIGNKVKDTAFGKVEDSKQREFRLNEEDFSKLKKEKGGLLKTKFSYQEELDGYDTIYGSPLQPGTKRWNEIHQEISEIDHSIQKIVLKIQDHLFAKEIGMTSHELDEKFKNIESAKPENLEDLVKILSSLEIITTDKERNNFLNDPKTRIDFIKKFISE